MKVKELKEWFKNIPVEFDNATIENIDIDYTGTIDILNLILKKQDKAIIKSLYRKPNYINTLKE